MNFSPEFDIEMGFLSMFGWFYLRLNSSKGLWGKGTLGIRGISFLCLGLGHDKARTSDKSSQFGQSDTCWSWERLQWRRLRCPNDSDGSTMTCHRLGGNSMRPLTRGLALIRMYVKRNLTSTCHLSFFLDLSSCLSLYLLVSLGGNTWGVCLEAFEWARGSAWVRVVVIFWRK